MGEWGMHAFVSLGGRCLVPATDVSLWLRALLLPLNSPRVWLPSLHLAGRFGGTGQHNKLTPHSPHSIRCANLPLKGNSHLHAWAPRAGRWRLCIQDERRCRPALGFCRRAGCCPRSAAYFAGCCSRIAGCCSRYGCCSRGLCRVCSSSAICVVRRAAATIHLAYPHTNPHTEIQDCRCLIFLSIFFPVHLYRPAKGRSIQWCDAVPNRLPCWLH